MNKNRDKGLKWHLLEKGVPSSLLIAAAKAPEGAQVLKESPVRFLCRVSGDKDTAIVKVNVALSILDRILAVLRLNPALREAKTLLQARKNGLHVPVPMAWIVDKGGSCRLLLQDMGELKNLLEIATGLRDVGKKAGALVGKLHKLGFLHKDLHGGNIHVDARNEIVITDFQSVSFKERPLSASEVESTLAFLFLSLKGRVGKREALTFLKEHERAFQNGRPGPIAPLGRAIIKRAAKLERRIWIKREKRAFRTCSEFERSKAAGATVITAKGLKAPSLEELEWLLEKGDGITIRQGRRGFVKKFGPWIVKGRDTRHAKALWLSHYMLQLRSIECPKALLLAVRKGGFSLVVTPYLEKHPRLDEYCESIDKKGPALDALLSALAGFIATLHAKGLRNRDMKASNLLVRPTPGETAIIPVDLDGLSRPIFLRAHIIAKDLSRICTGLLELSIEPAGLLTKYRAKAIEAGLSARIVDKALKDLFQSP